MVCLTMAFVPKTKLSKWLDGAYLDWQKREGGSRSVTEFAEYLEIPLPTVNHWINGTRNNLASENIFKLAVKLGLEVYDVLGLPRPNPILFGVQANFGLFTELELKRIAQIVEEARARHEKAEKNKRI